MYSMRWARHDLFMMQFLLNRNYTKSCFWGDEADIHNWWRSLVWPVGSRVKDITSGPSPFHNLSGSSPLHVNYLDNYSLNGGIDCPMYSMHKFCPQAELFHLNFIMVRLTESGNRVEYFQYSKTASMNSLANLWPFVANVRGNPGIKCNLFHFRSLSILDRGVDKFRCCPVYGISTCFFWSLTAFMSMNCIIMTYVWGFFSVSCQRHSKLCKQKYFCCSFPEIKGTHGKLDQIMVTSTRFKDVLHR